MLLLRAILGTVRVVEKPDNDVPIDDPSVPLHHQDFLSLPVCVCVCVCDIQAVQVSLSFNCTVNLI